MEKRGENGTMELKSGVEEESMDDDTSEEEAVLTECRDAILSRDDCNFNQSEERSISVPPSRSPSLYMPSSGYGRQWLLELALVLLVTTLLVTVCSKLSYEWLVRLCRISPERPI